MALVVAPAAAPGTVTPTAVVSLPDVKAALNKTDTADDAELQRLIDAALAEYREWVGPLPGTQTVRVRGGSPMLLPPRTLAVSAAAYTGSATPGAVLDLTGVDLDLQAGLLYAPARWAAYGRGDLALTVTVGPLPANHAQAVVADVAGLFTATQRGGGQTAPRFAGEGYAEPLAHPTGPVVLFPRIRALATARVA